jgi:hypothetical protein
MAAKCAEIVCLEDARDDTVHVLRDDMCGREELFAVLFRELVIGGLP